MKEKRYYSHCMASKRSGRTIVVDGFTDFCRATSSEAARAMAMEEMLKRFPLSEGWANHSASANDLDKVLAKFEAEASD